MENENMDTRKREEGKKTRRFDEIDVPKKTGLFAKVAIFLIFLFPLVCFIIMCKVMKWI